MTDPAQRVESGKRFLIASLHVIPKVLNNALSNAFQIMQNAVIKLMLVEPRIAQDMWRKLFGDTIDLGTRSCN